MEVRSKLCLILLEVAMLQKQDKSAGITHAAYNTQTVTQPL